MLIAKRKKQTTSGGKGGPTFKAVTRFVPKSDNNRECLSIVIPLEVLAKAENYREDKAGNPFLVFHCPDVSIPQPDG